MQKANIPDNNTVAIEMFSLPVQRVVVRASWIVSPIFALHRKLGKGDILFMVLSSHWNVSARVHLAASYDPILFHQRRCHNVLLVIFLGDWVVPVGMGMGILVIVFHGDVL